MGASDSTLMEESSYEKFEEAKDAYNSGNFDRSLSILLDLELIQTDLVDIMSNLNNASQLLLKVNIAICKYSVDKDLHYSSNIFEDITSCSEDHDQKSIYIQLGYNFASALLFEGCTAMSKSVIFKCLHSICTLKKEKSGVLNMVHGEFEVCALSILTDAFRSIKSEHILNHTIRLSWVLCCVLMAQELWHQARNVIEALENQIDKMYPAFYIQAEAIAIQDAETKGRMKAKTLFLKALCYAEANLPNIEKILKNALLLDARLEPATSLLSFIGLASQNKPNVNSKCLNNSFSTSWVNGDFIDVSGAQSNVIGGCMAFQEQKLKEAALFFRRALSLDPTCLNAAYGSAVVLWRSGDMINARQLLVTIGKEMENIDTESKKEKGIHVRILAQTDDFGAVKYTGMYARTTLLPVSFERILWLIAKASIQLNNWSNAKVALENLGNLSNKYRFSGTDSKTQDIGNFFYFSEQFLPSSTAAERCYMYVLLRIGLFKKALEKISHSLVGQNMSSLLDPVLLLYKADAYLCLEEDPNEILMCTNRALQILQKSRIPVSIRPNSAERSKKRLCKENNNTFLALGDLSAAERQARSMAHNNKALALLLNKATSRKTMIAACSHLHAALVYEPDALVLVFNLTLLLLRCGLKEAACRSWLRARKFGVDMDSVQLHVELQNSRQQKNELYKAKDCGSVVTQLVGESNLSVPSFQIYTLDVLMLTYWLNRAVRN